MDIADTNRDIAIQKITAMTPDQVQKVLIFMAGMEAGETGTESAPQQKGDIV